MRRFSKALALVLALVMVLALFAGCGGTKTDAPAAGGSTAGGSTAGGSTAGGSTSGGSASGANDDRVLRIAASGDTGTLYPFALSGGFVSLQYAFFDPLYTMEADGTVVYKLATAYDQIDDIHYTLKLREGVTFSNGSPFTAADVWFSMNLCKDDPRFYLNVGYIDFEKTSITNDYEMDIWYTGPTYTQKTSLTQLMILDEETFDLESMSRNPIGTGPYVCTDYVVNSHVTATAREDYWGGAPAIKTIEWKVLSEQSQIINALEIGDVDISSAPLTELDYIRDLGYEIVQSYGGYCNTALFSFNGPLADVNARLAVIHAMDRESMNYLFTRDLDDLPSFPTSDHTLDYRADYNNLTEAYSVGYNPELAKEYAEKAGLVGKTLKIITNGVETYNDVAAIMVENLAAIGVNAEIASYDSATYFGVVMDASNFDISLFYLSAPSMLAVDIMGYLDFLPLGWFDDDAQGYKDMCVNARSLLDDAERADYLLELLTYFEQFHPWYPISEAVGASALNKDIGGAKYYLAGNLFYNDLYWN